MDEKTGKREITVREITLHTALARVSGRLIYEDTLETVAVGDKAQDVFYFDIYGQPVHHYFRNKVAAIQYARDWASAILCRVKIQTE